MTWSLRLLLTHLETLSSHPPTAVSVTRRNSESTRHQASGKDGSSAQGPAISCMRRVQKREHWPDDALRSLGTPDAHSPALDVALAGPYPSAILK